LGSEELESGDFDDDDVQAAGGNYTFMLSLSTDNPLMIRGQEGFEKRWPIRCKRCKLVVGYQLDNGQFQQKSEPTASGRRDDVIYLLPGAVITTGEMKGGKMSV